MKGRIAKGFDLLAPIYDATARIIIGRSIVKSQRHFINRFKDCHYLLIIGGGSGWLLDTIYKECPNIEIDYVDISSAMIHQAKKRVGNNKSINFVHGSEDDIPNRLYDGVITNFYMDMFDEKGLPVVIDKIKRSLTDAALWVVTDFVSKRKTDRVTLWLMYRFFRIITHIDANQLADWQHHMSNAGCICVDRGEFKSGFILTNIYQIHASS